MSDPTTWAGRLSSRNPANPERESYGRACLERSNVQGCRVLIRRPIQKSRNSPVESFITSSCVVWFVRCLITEQRIEESKAILDKYPHRLPVRVAGKFKRSKERVS